MIRLAQKIMIEIMMKLLNDLYLYICNNNNPTADFSILTIIIMPLFYRTQQKQYQNYIIVDYFNRVCMF
jgi:hypothetical protein